MGLIDVEEPIERLFSQGMIYKDGLKMSKSKGNVVSPDKLIKRFGADTERLYTLFAGPPDRDAEWNDTAVEGAYKFLNRVWRMMEDQPFDVAQLESSRALLDRGDLPENVASLHRKTHQTIRKVTSDMDTFHFNTGIAALMELVNATRSFVDALGENEPSAVERAAISESLASTTMLLGPMVPHFAEEIWERMGGQDTLFRQEWPSFDAEVAREDVVTIAIQINGKLRGDVEVEKGADEESVLGLAKADEGIARHLEGKSVRRVIFVPDRLLNLVVG
jgi:leucyl-tRNA synthetase